MRKIWFFSPAVVAAESNWGLFSPRSDDVGRGLARLRFYYVLPCFPGVLFITPKIPEISVGIKLVRFGLFRPEYSRSPLVVVHLFRLEFSLIREIGKGIKSGKSHSCWLALFKRKTLTGWVIKIEVWQSYHKR